MQQRRGTAQQWTDADPILAAGEIGFETDTGQFKIGDGTNHWADISYFKNLEDLGGSLDDYILLTEKGASNGVATLNGSGRIPLSQLAELVDGAPDALNTIREIADAITAVDGAVDAHNAATTGVHGITDTALLAKLADITEHSNDTTNIHGIADTSLLVDADALADAINDALNTAAADATTKANAAQAAAATDASTKATAAQTAAGVASAAAISEHSADTTNVHGISDTSALVVTTDSRLSDTRTPSDASVTDAKISGTLSQNKITNLTSDLAAKAPLAGPTFTGTVVLPSTTSIGNVSATELGYVDGVTSSIQTQIDAKAPLASPALTGTPTAPTATAGTNTTQIATTAFVKTAVADLVASAPAALDTLNELASALGNDASFSTTLTNNLALKAPLASPTFTGTVVLPSTTSIGNVSATELGYVDGVTSSIQTQLDAKATKTALDAATITTFNAQSSSYTLALGDSTNMVEMTGSSANTVTIPTNASVAFPVGTAIDIFQRGTGQTTIAGASGVTVLYTPGLKLRAQYSAATAVKRDTDTWIVSGDLTA